MRSETVQQPQPAIAVQGDTGRFVLAHWTLLEREKDGRIFGCEKAKGGGRQCMPAHVLVLSWLLEGSFSSNNRVHIHLYS